MIIDVLALLSIVLILLLAYLKKQLTNKAIIMAFIVGTSLYFCGGLLFLFSLYLFFLSSICVSGIKKKYKNKILSEVHNKNGKRDTIQVLANSLLAVILGIIFYVTDNEIYKILVLISFSSYNADTWASELGILSKSNPIFLIGLKKVQKGISGGVTLVGLFMSFLGSMLIALLYIIFNLNTNPLDLFQVFSLITIFGFLGSIIDSILGQFFQVLYYDKRTGKYTEKLNKNNEKVKGYTFITNDVVNFIAPLISIILYIIIFY